SCFATAVPEMVGGVPVCSVPERMSHSCTFLAIKRCFGRDHLQMNSANTHSEAEVHPSEASDGLKNT
ncbi:hypothetical protein, partial [Pseudomonas viridiflava]|uniref:hypothetical protein n=1 Tax=Pseudomonas viridiflava TaxID=33069 RepID=UPI0019678ECC